MSRELLKIIAMVAMLCDHAGYRLFPEIEILTCIGRLAFPIFAFQLVEGFFKTSSHKKSLLTLLVFAIISEIPFNLFLELKPNYIFHQNIMFTLFLAYGAMLILEKLKTCKNDFAKMFFSLAVFVGAFLIAEFAFVDYGGVGVLFVLGFYYTYFTKPRNVSMITQGLVFYWINFEMLRSYTLPLLGFDFPVQGFAIFALPLIWLYNGKKLLSEKADKVFKCVGYLFYPCHLIILFLLSLFIF